MSSVNDDYEKKTLSFYGGSWVSYMPLLLFILGIITTTLYWKSFSDGAVWLPAFLGILIGFFFCKDKGKYAEAIVDGISSKDVAIPVVCWLFAGVFAQVLRDSGFASGIAGLAVEFGVGGTMFTVIVFIFCSFFSFSTGSGFGTIAMGMGILYPSSILLGCDPALVAGTILGAAALGNFMSPVADVLISSATCMRVSIVDCVRARFKLGMATAIITVFIISIAGYFLNSAHSNPISIEANHLSLIMFIPLAITLYIAIKTGDIVTSTTIGILLSSIFAVSFGLMDFIQINPENIFINSLVKVSSVGEKNIIEGTIFTGLDGMIQVVVLCLLLFASVNIMRAGNGDIVLLNQLGKIAKGKKVSELVISCMTVILCTLISINAPVVLLVGSSFAKPLADKYNIDPLRMASVISAHACTSCFMAPWTAPVLLMMGFASSAGTPLSNVAAGPFVYYSIVLTIVMIIYTLNSSD